MKHALLQKDPALAPIFETELVIDETIGKVYDDLVQSIVSQQLSVKAAATIYGRFLDLFENRNPFPEAVLEIDTEKMRGAGLSYQKASYIKNIAAFWLEHGHQKTDWTVMTDEDIIAELTKIKGVGKWTVEMVLIFTLKRPDVFPIDDLGIRQGMVRLYKLDLEGKPLYAKLKEIAQSWKPYSTYVSRHLWAWKDGK